MRFLDSKTSYGQLNIILSRTLSMLESKNIEREFEHFSLHLFSKMEMTFVDFRIDGKHQKKRKNQRLAT